MMFDVQISERADAAFSKMREHVARSLRAFCEKYNPRFAVRSSMSDFREQEWMTNVPLYDLLYLANYLSE